MKTALLWLMSAFYVFAGLMHFVNPGFYLQMMPPYLPAHGALVFLSGVAEVVLGVAVLVPSLRRLAGWGIVALLIAVFPANLHMALHQLPIHGGPAFMETPDPVALWLRLPLQLVLIAWALWVTRDRAPAGAALSPAGLARGRPSS